MRTTDKIAHYILNRMDIDFESSPMRIINKINVEVTNMMDDAIVQACINAARAEGVHDLFLLDKKFVLDALWEKIQRSMRGYWKEENSFIKCSLCGTYETKYDHLGNLNDFDYCPNCGARMDGDPHDGS